MGKDEKVQWTLEQHGFKLHRSTYLYVNNNFSIVNTAVLHDPRIVEFSNAEPRIQRNHGNADFQRP